MGSRRELSLSDMAGLFDTHCHLYMEPLSRETNGVLERAFSIGVERLLVPAVSADNWDICSELSLLPGISCALGVHPWWADDGVDVEELKSRIISSNASAIGEIGLDWKTEVSRQKQYSVFQKQLELASEMDIPVLLHCRNAFEEMLELLDRFPVRGTVHGWSRGTQLMNRFLQTGLHISFGGAITRPGAKKARESAISIPSDRFVLETDSPSIGLSGVPSGQSEPAHVSEIAQFMADLRGVDYEEIKTLAWNNSIELFGDTC